LIGIFIGIAIYNAIILDLHFPLVVYKKLVGIAPILQDIATVDEEVFENLSKLLSLGGEELVELELPFEASYKSFGEPVSIPLKEGGSEEFVTPQNVTEYIQLYLEWMLDSSISSQFQAFRKGFLKVCGGRALSMFIPQELELLICGNPKLDFQALERVTQYMDGFTEESRAIQFFWEVIHEMAMEEQKSFLKFVSGSDRAPIDGLSSMTFIISKSGGDTDRLPSAHTCFNHMLLPDYPSKEIMKQKILIAIQESEGFGLK